MAAEAHQRRRRPTGWIVMTAVLAVVAVGLGIWAFSAQSDADDAQAKLDAQEQAASATPAPAEISAETEQRFEEVKQQLGITGENVDELNDQMSETVANLEKAEQARTDAVGAIDRATAEVDAFEARAAVAQTCLRGSFDALDAAFSDGGLAAAVTELESISGECRPAESP